MAQNQSILQVYETGQLTVVGFGGQSILDQIDLTACRAEIVSILEQHHCKVLAFDLTGVKLIPSGMLGLLASLRQMGIEVHLYNPSEDISEVLEITQLNKLMPVHHIDLENGPVRKPKPKPK